MSSRLPTTVRFSLEVFARHGGLDGPHKDGWGIAHYDEGDIRLIREPAPAAHSACVQFVQDHPFRSSIVISHIRKATRGKTALRNCQPFARELGGRMHVFAHNGDLNERRLREWLVLRNYRPIGDTDSEYAFCGLLEQLRERWLEDPLPSVADRREAVRRFAATLSEFGPANFLYCDSDALFIHGHKRTQADGTIHAPGLHVLERECVENAAVTVPGLSIESDTVQRVLLAASVPLSAERAWRALGEGEIVVVRQGQTLQG